MKETLNGIAVRSPYSLLALFTDLLVASKVFSAMSGKMLLCTDMMATYHAIVFDMLRMDIQATFFMIPQLIQGTSTLHNSRCSQS